MRFVLLLASVLAFAYGGSITRNKRGYLSRTGLCPNPADNLQKRDVRLNYWGRAVIRESDDPDPKCNEPECDDDSHCDGNRKCCSNYCGAKVCTVSMRDPHPCSGFHCPDGETCRVTLVKCVMPDCPVAEAINRPTCVPKEKLHVEHAETLGDYMPDNTAELIKSAAAANAQNQALDYNQQTQDPTAYQPMADAMQGQATALPYTNEQAYAAPVAPSDMSAAPAEVPNVVQSPMETSSFTAPSQDVANALSFQGAPAEAPLMDQPQVVAQPPAQPADAPLMDQPQIVAQPPADAPQMDQPQVVAQPPAQ